MSRPTSPPAVPAGPSPAELIARALARAGRLLLLTHEHPDGDGLGAMLALCDTLRRLGKHVDGALLEPCPHKYHYLPGADCLLTMPSAADYDCAVALDCDGERRLGALQPAFRAARQTLCIDHHEAEDTFADLNWCDGTQAAVSLMVYDLIGCLGGAVTEQAATCLYSGIVADTGVFRFRNTSARALSVAAALVSAGADPSEIARRVSDQIPVAKARLLGRALEGVACHENGSILVSVLELADFAQTAALPEHTDGLIDDLKRIQGAEIIILVREQAPAVWRVSLRSIGVDVAAICRRLGGGGHRLAAGCELTGPRATVVERLLAESVPALEAPREP